MSDMTRLRKAFDAAQQAADLRNRIQGRLGKRNPDGSVSMTVSGKPHHLHVSLGPDGDQGVSIAKNMGVQRIPGLPVYMRLEYGELVIYGLDGTTGHLEQFLGANTTNVGAPPHNHRTGSGLEYEVEALHLEPGRTRWAGSGMNVHVNPFRYKHAGDWETWGGGSIDLTSVQPATAERWAWVLVGVDPDTNTLVAEAGDEYTFGTPLTPELINDIAFTGYIPTGAIRVRQDDTALNRIERYHDARLWIQPGGDGGAADVGAEIDGAPEQTTLADTDRHALTDAGVLKWASWANIKSTLTALFDGLYAAIGHNHDGVYSLVSHLHDDRYSLLAHNHAHNSLTGLTTGDAHTQYALLAGRAGGQTLIGGTASGNNLTLESTAHATKGRVELGKDGSPVTIGDYGDFFFSGTDFGVRSDEDGIGGMEMRNPNTGTAADVRVSLLVSGSIADGGLNFALPGLNNSAANIFGLARAASAYLFSRNRNLGIGPLDSGHDLVLGTNNIERVRVTSAGNVGIGTDSPQTRFHVALEADGGHAVRSVSLTSTGTWVTVLSSGTVGALVQLRGVISRSGHASGVSGTIALGAPAATIYSNGGNVVDAEVTSGGVFRVQRSAGSATITVALDMVWI